ncbi:acyl carrier protein [Pedobacter gandavensis]|uniref:acyl carrier protein n=1 Tax=Pedobacter gandavensis TaxID=2679963 RepID=UPI002930744F|nr:acyl carrier protein [Pedobacter gandavensis]
MDRSSILSKLKVIVANYSHDKDALDYLNESTDFIKDLKINSANLVDVVLDVEEEFDIEIDNLSMEKMLNVSAAIEIITDKLKAK